MSPLPNIQIPEILQRFLLTGSLTHNSKLTAENWKHDPRTAANADDIQLI
jgi:hypothetical protein